MADVERVWLVERTVDDGKLLRLVYATPDGDRVWTRQRSLHGGGEVTAAREVDADRLDPVEDPETRERYRREVDRVRADHDPDDPV
ncbi:MAG: hypothetical protein ABEJ08_00230 [Halobacteriaceae archaeon]